MSGLYDAPGWRPGRELRNGVDPNVPEHHSWPPVPVRAHLVWDNGDEELLDTVADGWTGGYVRVLMTSTNYRANYAWLRVEDVVRR